MNGGNDIMYDVKLQVNDVPGLSISPTTVSIGDLDSDTIATVDLRLKTESSLSEGILGIPFKITYKDFRGTTHKEEFKSEISIRKASAKILMKLDKEEIVYNTEVTVEASISNPVGEPLSNQPIEFFLDNKSIGVHLTDETGVALTTLDKKIDVGVHEVKVLYRGSSIYVQTFTIKTLNVLPSTTNMQLSIPSNLQVGEEAIAYVKIFDERGSPIVDAEILIYCDDIHVSTGFTNRTGEAKIPFVVISEGDKNIKAIYGGDLNHQETENVKALKAEILQTVLTIEAPTRVVKGQEVTYTVQLTDELGRSLPDAEIEIMILSDDTSIANFIVKTNNLGHAEGSFTIERGGELSISALYKGNERYAPVETSSILTVTATSILALLTIPIVGALGVILAVIFWKRGSLSLLQRTLNRGTRGSTVNIKRCIACNRDIPIEATYCDICGTTQSTSPTIEEQVPRITEPSHPPEAATSEDIYRELDLRVLSYIEKSGGEISLSNGIKELGISREELLAAIDRLRKAGRLEPV
jgi:hypothetical protein